MHGSILMFRTRQQSCKMDGSYQVPNETIFLSTVYHPYGLKFCPVCDLTQRTVSMLVYDCDHEDTEVVCRRNK